MSTVLASELWPLTNDTLVGQFEQTISDENGELLYASYGHFALAKPRQFRWEVEGPGRQLFISDGNTLWQLDFDLDTTTKQSWSADNDSPLELLMADEASLAQRFRIVREQGSVTLSPLAEGENFQAVTLQDLNVDQYEMIIVDNLQQRIRVVLTVEPSEVPGEDAFTAPSFDNGSDRE
jgi:outer membrane lipoprotein carrier protein